MSETYLDRKCQYSTDQSEGRGQSPRCRLWVWFATDPCRRLALLVAGEYGGRKNGEAIT